MTLPIGVVKGSYESEFIKTNYPNAPIAESIFPEYTVRWIEAEIDELADRPGAGFAVSEEDKSIFCLF